MAQEAVTWFDQGQNREALRNIRHTALRNLSRVAQGAEVFEQVDIVLRYQGARNVIPDSSATLLRAKLGELDAGEHGMGGVRSFLAHMVRLHRVVDSGRRG